MLQHARHYLAWAGRPAIEVTALRFVSHERGFRRALSLRGEAINHSAVLPPGVYLLEAKLLRDSSTICATASHLYVSAFTDLVAANDHSFDGLSVAGPHSSWRTRRRSPLWPGSYDRYEPLHEAAAQTSLDVAQGKSVLLLGA